LCVRVRVSLADICILDSGQPQNCRPMALLDVSCRLSAAYWPICNLINKSAWGQRDRRWSLRSLCNFSGTLCGCKWQFQRRNNANAQNASTLKAINLNCWLRRHSHKKKRRENISIIWQLCWKKFPELKEYLRDKG